MMSCVRRFRLRPQKESSFFRKLGKQQTGHFHPQPVRVRVHWRFPPYCAMAGLTLTLRWKKDWLISSYGGRAFTKNYETSAAIMCFRELKDAADYEAIIKNAEAYLRGIQATDESGDFASGGMGYGGDSRPDLSNTAFMIDALRASGASEDDEAIQRALAFVSRCQNMESEHNTTPFAAKSNDGGFYYSCLISEQDEEKLTANGGLRSYGTMTYAGFKSMIYAGLEKDDPRVIAALGWMKKNYDLKTNPGMGDAGLYYYYVTLAKTLDALGQDTFTDDKGVEHQWRQELADELLSR
jgi:squalene-hopene/tetraprenyl-beta-curcumene cyclase